MIVDDNRVVLFLVCCWQPHCVSSVCADVSVADKPEPRNRQLSELQKVNGRRGKKRKQPFLGNQIVYEIFICTS